ncbi:MAG: hypothetical protein CL878_08545 [Dehalococcoidia bacterium]|nr:hypothetical protein [Dehalococcoidia bacterium]
MARITRRRSLGGGAAVLGGLLAAACGDPTVRYVGQPQAGPAGPAGPQGPKGATGAQGAQGAAGAAGKPPVTVTIWGTWYGWRGEDTTNERAIGLKQLVDEWNGSGSHVFVDFAGKGTRDKIVTAYAADQHPDIHDPAYFDAGLYGQNGMLVDMNDYIKADKEYSDSLSDYFPFLLETSSWEGKFWSLPWYTNADLPYTNLAHVREAGLEPLKLGYTWDDLTEYLKKLQTSHGKGMETNKWAMGGMTNQVQFWNLLMQNGGAIYNGDFTKAVFNSPEGVEAGQFVHDLIHKHEAHTPHNDVFKARGVDRPSFRQGQITMFYETSARRIKTWAEDIGGLQNMYVTPSPTKKQPFAGNYGRNWLIYKSTGERQEAAWEFTRWVTSTDQNAHYVVSIAFPPARKSIFSHPKWKALEAEIPQFQTFVDAVVNYGYRPWHPNLGTHYRAVGAAMGEVYKSPNVSVKEHLDAVAQQVNLDIDKFRAEYKG